MKTERARPFPLLNDSRGNPSANPENVKKEKRADADFEGTDAERTIEPTLVTATEDFGDKTRMKRLEKRGCSFGADGDVRLFIVPDPATDEEGDPVTEGFEVRPYGTNGRYAFRPTDAAGRGFCAVVKGRGRTEIGDIVLKARKTKPIGGRRLK